MAKAKVMSYAVDKPRDLIGLDPAIQSWIDNLGSGVVDVKIIDTVDRVRESLNDDYGTNTFPIIRTVIVLYEEEKRYR